MSHTLPRIQPGSKVRVMQTDSMILKKLAGLTGTVGGIQQGDTEAFVHFDNGRQPALVPISSLVLSGARKHAVPVTQVACPRCGVQQNARGPDAEYHCHNCGGRFDSDPDEGGNYSNDPTKRAERGER